MSGVMYFDANGKRIEAPTYALADAKAHFDADDVRVADFRRRQAAKQKRRDANKAEQN